MLRTGRWRYGRPRLASPSVFALLLVSSVTAGTLWLARKAGRFTGAAVTRTVLA